MISYCQSLIPTEYEKAAKILSDKGSTIKLAKLDATVHMEQAKENQVTIYYPLPMLTTYLTKGTYLMQFRMT